MDEIKEYKEFIKQISLEIESWPKWKNDLFNNAFLINPSSNKIKILSIEKLIKDKNSMFYSLPL